MKRIKDLRDYIKRLEGLGELNEIDVEVDWELEVGAVLRRAYDLGAPAPLFNTIKDSEKGFRILGASAGLSSQRGLKFARIAISLGFSPTTGAVEIINTIADALEKKPIPPITVDQGVCQENVMMGDDIDIMKFPVPLIHGGDGGRYINTWGTIVAQTPDKSWTNWSINRVMVLDKNRMTGLVPPQQHLGIIRSMWQEISKPMPFAIALGCEPAVPMFSGMPINQGVDEAGVLGAHFGEPIELVDCKTVDLKVPATCEIVIEGHISNTETVSEGPMGEFAGYIGEPEHEPVYHISAITHRNDPILPIVAAGVPVEDTHTCCGTMYSAAILAELRRHNFPAASCFCLLESAVHWLVVTVDRQHHTLESAKNLAHDAKDIIFKSKPGIDIPKVILLDDDIDPSDVNQVVWAFATRCHPDKDAHLYQHQRTMPLIHYLTKVEKKDTSSTKVVYNGLLPDFDRSHIASFEYGYPEEIKNRVMENWGKYGYRD